jgi:phosphoserine phosphatase
MAVRILHPSAVPALVSAASDHGCVKAAVFDADGTLWAGDIGDVAFAQSARAGLVSDAMFAGPLSSWAARVGLSLPDNKVEAIAAIVAAHDDGQIRESGLRRGLDEDAWRRDFYEMQAWIFADQPREAVSALGQRLMRDGLGARIFPSMQRLLRDLEADDVVVHIASASHAALVQAGAAILGIPPERVAGMEPTPGLSTTMQVRTYGDDKRDTAVARLGGRPLAAFGDSVLFTDRALLQAAAYAFAVATSGAHREAALADARIVLVDP